MGINRLRDVPERLRVVYDGIVYYPTEYLLRGDGHGNPAHYGVMHDLRADSLTIGELEKIEKLEEHEDA